MTMESCRICPRSCGVSRGKTGNGFCHSGGEIRIARAALHHWEEPPISGTRGSGAVFFTGCPLRCVFCQNYEISAGENLGKTVTPEELSGLFFSLVEQGAHNINLVTPTHFAPLVREALLVKKLPVPVVYNTSGYETVETLRTLEGLVDIYLPDYKYAEPELARALSKAPDYPEIARNAIREMARQVGAPQYGKDGLMARGVLIRHLILPGHTKNSIAVLRSVREEFPGLPVSLMAQYTPAGGVLVDTPAGGILVDTPAGGVLVDTPAGDAAPFPELSRPITKRELEKVQNEMFALDLDGFVQSRKAKGAQYIPNFHQFTE